MTFALFVLRYVGDRQAGTCGLRPRASFNFTSYLSTLNSFKRERATSFTDSTANGRIL